MCEKNETIQFCSCKAKKEWTPLELRRVSFESTFVEGEYTKTYYKWTLNKISGKVHEDAGIMGQIVNPVKRFDNEMTGEYVVEELNRGINLFDFEYIAIDGDELMISKEYKYIKLKEFPRPYIYGQYMIFVYENGEWYFGYVSDFEYRKEKINFGSIKIITN